MLGNLLTLHGSLTGGGPLSAGDAYSPANGSKSSTSAHLPSGFCSLDRAGDGPSNTDQAASSLSTPRKRSLEGSVEPTRSLRPRRSTPRYVHRIHITSSSDAYADEDTLGGLEASVDNYANALDANRPDNIEEDDRSDCTGSADDSLVDESEQDTDDDDSDDDIEYVYLSDTDDDDYDPINKQLRRTRHITEENLQEIFEDEIPMETNDESTDVACLEEECWVQEDHAMEYGDWFEGEAPVQEKEQPLNSMDEVNGAENGSAVDNAHLKNVTIQDNLPKLELELAQAVPCEYRCGKMFVSYLSANRHGLKKCPSKQPLLRCPWKDLIGCKYTSKKIRQLVEHYRFHSFEYSAPHPCRRACGRSYPNPYIRASHEHICSRALKTNYIKPVQYLGSKRPNYNQTSRPVEKRVCKPKKASMKPMKPQDKPKDKPRPRNSMTPRTDSKVIRVALSSGRPHVIFVARSSGRPPHTWYDEQTELQDGLSHWIQPHCREYRMLFNDPRPRVLFAAYNMQTFLLPAVEDFASGTNFRKTNNSLRRARRLTQAITDDLVEIQDYDPVIVSIGADGWAAHSKTIKQYLMTVPAFRLVVQHATLEYAHGQLKLSQDFLVKGNDSWWGVYKSSEILAALDTGHTANKAVAELIEVWDYIQTGKDFRSNYPILAGRNKRRSWW